MTYAEYWLGKLRIARDNCWISIGEWIKRLLNCLPGRFGQRGHRWVDDERISCDKPYCAWTHVDAYGRAERRRCISWHTQREECHQWGPEAVPAIAAWICSAGRRMVHDIRQCLNDGDLIYWDTDGGIVTQSGMDSLRRCGMIRDREPGYLRVEGSTDGCDIRGYRDYTCGNKTVHAGVPHSAIQTAPGSGSYWVRTHMRTAQLLGQTPSAGRTLVSYTGGGAYRHGIVSPSSTVTPYTLPDMLPQLMGRSGHEIQVPGTDTSPW